MSLTNYVASKNRVYVRKFDHDEARARYAAGETIRALADGYGVTWNAVQRVVKPESYAAHLEASRRWRTGTCEMCSGPAQRLVTGKKQHNTDGRVLCVTCRAKTRRKQIRLGADGEILVECWSCRTWKPVTEFGPRVTRRLINDKALGRTACCRACETAARRDYRERHKVPCERCGQPCLPPSEKGNRASHRALCRSCYRSRSSVAA